MKKVGPGHGCPLNATNKKMKEKISFVEFNLSLL